MGKNSVVILTIMVAAICYGILHDMVTAHLCVEYFTIGHPKIIESESPVVLALTWGVVATWWIALPMGILITLFNHLGSYPSLTYRQLMYLVLKLLLIMSGLAVAAGITGHFLAQSGVIFLIPPLSEQIDTDTHNRFLAAGASHICSYVAGITGTLFLCGIILRKRKTDLQ